MKPVPFRCYENKMRNANPSVTEIRRGFIALLSALFALIFTLGVTPLAHAALNDNQKQVLQNISDVMNANATLTGNFIQTGPNGDTARGIFYLKRPGQIRFKYEQPASIDIIADGKSVAVINTRLETQDLLPIKKTPLRYLLRRNLNLNKVDGIKNVGLLGNNIVVIIEDPQAFNESQLRLFFHKDTYALEQWIVTDAQGLDTSVELFDIQKDTDVEPELFVIKYPGQ